MEYEAAAGGRGVDPFLKGPQAHASLPQLAHEVDQMPD
jgi:hypothetical protein